MSETISEVPIFSFCKMDAETTCICENCIGKRLCWRKMALKPPQASLSTSMAETWGGRLLTPKNASTSHITLDFVGGDSPKERLIRAT